MMRKTISILAAFLTSLWTIPADAAGTVPGFSLTVQFDNSHNVAGGCILYVIQAGTTSTPQTAYQDSGLTIPVPGGSQVTCDANGRLPQFFLADGQIKFRLTDKFGGQIFVADNLLVVGPSSGGGGGGSVDPTTILATGDFKAAYGTGPITGFVRCNGRTIGSSTSGASERANADTSALYSFLWNSDPNLVVTGGRGASAAADFSANKSMALPDCRGRALAGLDDMGNSAAGRLTSAYFGTSPIVLGAAGGTQSHTLTTAELPPINSTATQTITVAPVGVNIAAASVSITDISVTGGGVNATLPFASTGHWSNIASISGSNTISVNSTGTNGSAHSIVAPELLTTFYIKL